MLISMDGVIAMVMDKLVLVLWINLFAGVFITQRVLIVKDVCHYIITEHGCQLHHQHKQIPVKVS